jgi:hypothetical protein
MPLTGTGRLLDELGFYVDSISEVRITTVNGDGSFNAAPMGVVRKEVEHIEIRPYKTSSTHANLVRHSKACVNVTDDPVTYMMTAFKEESFPHQKVHSIDMDLRLSSSDAHVFLVVDGSHDHSEDRSSFKCRVVGIEIKRPFPRAFSRGRAEAIEAVIHATRIEHCIKVSELTKLETLIKQFHMCKDIVERVSHPESREAMVIRELERLIAEWRDRL